MLNDPELKTKHLKTGEVLVNQGEHSTDFYVLVSGTVAIVIGTSRIATIDQPNMFLGEMSFFIGDRRTATVIALSDVEVQVIPKDKVLDLFAKNPDFAVSVAGSLAQNLKDTSNKVAELRNRQDYLDKLLRYAKNMPELDKQIKEFDKVMQERQKILQEFINEKSIMSQKIIHPLTQSTKYSIKNLVGIEAERGESFFLEENDIEMAAGSVVNIEGDCEGWYALAFPKETAIAMSERMLGEEQNDLNEETVSFIKELNNIMSAQLITRIKEYDLSISTPVTVLNENALNSMIKMDPSLVFPYDTELGRFYTVLNIKIASGS
ncbi:MAG: cyclic nucleotide-binding domain-containing protein [Candidatus Woesearchaeota archaeon]